MLDMRSPDYVRVQLAAVRSEPTPLDVAARLMERGVNMDALEATLERRVAQERK